MKQLFTIIGSILLSVSTYAQVGINNPNPDTSAVLDVTSTSKGFLPPRMTADQRDNITTPTTGLMIFCTDCASGEGELQIRYTSGWKNIIGGDVNDPPPPPQIGDYYRGGVIFYIYQEGDTGYVAGEVHGLIAATADMSSTAAWGCRGTSIVDTSNAIGTGAANTAAIIIGCSDPSIAAKLCDDYTIDDNGVTYDDWFLPSKDEFNKLYEQKDEVGSFANGFYWNSTQAERYNAFAQDIDNGSQGIDNKNNPKPVRAIRAF